MTQGDKFMEKTPHKLFNLFPIQLNSGSFINYKILNYIYNMI